MSKYILCCSEEHEREKSILILETGKNIVRTASVLIFDISKTGNSITDYIDEEKTVIYDSADLLNQVCSLEQAVVESGRDNFDIIPAPAVPDKEIENSSGIFSRIFKMTNGKYDYIIIKAEDIDYNTDYEIIDRIIIMTGSSIGDINKIYEIKKTIGKERINRTLFYLTGIEKGKIKSGNMLTAKEMEKMLEVKVIVGFQAPEEDYNFKKGNKNVAVFVEKQKRNLYS